MISVGIWLPVLFLAVILAVWITFTITRLDRLHARVDAAWAAVDAQLVRRAAALLQGAEAAAANPRAGPDFDARPLIEVAGQALHAGPDGREVIENRVGRSIVELADSADLVGARAGGELNEACVRLLIARGFYNDAVRDTQSLRQRRMPRILHLSGHREVPQFFDIDDGQQFPSEIGSGGTPAAPAAEPARPVAQVEDAQ